MSDDGKVVMMPGEHEEVVDSGFKLEELSVLLDSAFGAMLESVVQKSDPQEAKRHLARLRRVATDIGKSIDALDEKLSSLDTEIHNG